MGMFIRNFGDIREGEYPKLNNPQQDDVKEMRALLSSMRLDGSSASSPGSASSPRNKGDSPQEVRGVTPQSLGSGTPMDFATQQPEIAPGGSYEHYS